MVFYVHRFRRLMTPDDRSSSVVQQLRRDRAQHAHIAAFVHLLQSLYLAAQNIGLLRPTLVTPTLLNIDRARRPSTMYCVIAWRGIHRPTMIS